MARAPRKPRSRTTATTPPETDGAPTLRRLDDHTIRRLVLQTFGRSRQTQDSPVMPDVWMRFIRDAAATAQASIEKREVQKSRPDLLLTPQTGTTVGDIVKLLHDRLPKNDLVAARIAQSSSRIVAAVDFYNLVKVIVPATGWWQSLDERLRNLKSTIEWMQNTTSQDDDIDSVLSHAEVSVEFFRYATMVGFIDRLMQVETSQDLASLILLARRLGPTVREDETDHLEGRRHLGDPLPKLREMQRLIEGYAHASGDEMSPPLGLKAKGPSAPRETPGIYLVNLNRPASQSLFDSRKTIKADAALRLFDISTEGVAFAVIDGGIDATHKAFLKRSAKFVRDELAKDDPTFEAKDLELFSRIAATYDFTVLRDIMAASGQPDAPLTGPNAALVARLRKGDATKQNIEHLSIRSANARDVDWAIVAPLIRVSHDKDYRIPGSDHGTHVAGILCADLPDPEDLNEPLRGICPDLTLYDLRVFDADGRGDEFAILCAIEFVGWLNRNRDYPVVHGVNLSLALRHDVDSFACGRTPVCDACNRLVGSGTVVVAAAGNTGFAASAQNESLGTGYRSISITDPGNAEAVITVGSTHRRDPHAYGVSYFSGRGPTGDGRRKPDILAPGEKITSTIRDNRSQRMDGTSMAAPHVSGATALLMARYPELVGHPLRIKQILMSTATDLGREPQFQGAGLLDILRALQSV